MNKSIILCLASLLMPGSYNVSVMDFLKDATAVARVLDYSVQEGVHAIGNDGTLYIPSIYHLAETETL
jgi:hypothetical protein